MKAPLYSKEGKKKGEVVLNPEVYNARVNEVLLGTVHRLYAGNLRRGTAATKTRKEVRGGGKKPWRQKGTGRARAGSSRSPIWRGGGAVFGPHPRNYTVGIPKSMRKSALVSALSLRAGEKNVVLLEDAKLDTAKTKELAEIIKHLPLKNKRALCVVGQVEVNIKRASQNLKGLVRVRPAGDLNAWDILQREKIIIEKAALPLIEERLLALKGEKETKAKKAAPKASKSSGTKKSS